ncbi:MAG: putative membrane protein [Candidatus Endobugula sp.]|jgi:putative membrane protein
MLKKLSSIGIRNQKVAFAFLIATHTAGAIGLLYEPTSALFQMLTPFNLLVTGALIFHFEEKKTTSYFIFIFLIAALGFFAEVLGVKTGVIFGEYTYGDTLGFKIFDVPLSIGLNWAILIYISGIVSNRIAKNTIVRSVIGALIMVVLDILIEPVAIEYDFWNWGAANIPMQNYFGWFILSLLLHGIFQKLKFEKNNTLALKLLIIQFIFFAVLNFLN